MAIGGEMNHVWVIEQGGDVYRTLLSRTAAREQKDMCAKIYKGDNWKIVKYTNEPELLNIIKRITAEFNETKKKNRILETELLDACKRNAKLRDEIKRLKRKADLDGVNT